jgi:isoleucyl-tRNA synthetase
MEEEILKFWKEKKIFEKLKEKNKGSKKRFRFLDGPITANNPMGVHHGWGRTYKDLFQRYKAMNGYEERYQNGFDCQGLWIEVEVEKELGFKNKKDIETYGIAPFVEKCKDRAKKYSGIQTEQSKRLGQWMDWDHSYYTMSDENNYTIWHFLKTCHEKGYLYKGRDSVPWCPRCGTAISQHEILTEEYKEITHDSVFFTLPIVEKPGEYFLVWTTTPWTLPANVSLAINPELTYLKTKDKSGKILYFVSKKDSLPLEKLQEVKPLEEKFSLEVLEKIKGKELLGLTYEGPFDDLPAVQAAKKEKPKTFHKVYAAEDFVTAEEGTGIVHIAPGCGSEDFRLGKENDMPVIDVIDQEAIYLEYMGEFSGQNAKDDPYIILNVLKKKNDGKYFFEIEAYTHRYPTCWRCKDELVWRVVDEWYISMDELRRKMMKVAQKINWLPEFGLDREMDWLQNMHDWLISKKRYWGLALPIWECECGNFEVIGSKEELKEKAVEGWDKFDGQSPHRPWIDKIKIKCPKCGKPVSRIRDVGNPWLDAGIVPFSTLIDSKTGKVSYLDDKKYWKEWFPFDFITECFPGQFKNWFYSLIAMSTVLEDTNPFKTILGHGLVKDERGEEMHKSKGNAIWFDDAVKKMGADVMRWMYCANNYAEDLKFGYKRGDEIRSKVFLILWNVFTFYKLFSANEKIDENLYKKSTNILDKWILSRLHQTNKEVSDAIESWNPQKAITPLEKLVTELSTWYLRRSRERVKRGEEKEIALSVLRHVLFELIKLMAPITPFFTEKIYQEMGGPKESVHLEDWPEFEKKLIDEKVLNQMETAQKIVEAGLAARASAGIKIRQPLASYSTTLTKDLPKEYIDIVKEELNILDLKFGEDKLDTELTEELKAQGLVREIVRTVNSLRKEAGLTIADRISLYYDGAAAEKIVADFGEKIKRETLSNNLEKSRADVLGQKEIEGIWLGIKKT